MSELVKMARHMLRKFLGIDIIGVGNTATFQFHLAQLLERHEINLVLDIGANDGQFALKLREIGFRGRIYSFEPVARSFKRLQAAAAADPDWSVYKIAMGRTAGTAKINVSHATVFSSFLTPNGFGKATFDEMRTESSENVQILTLDSFLEQHVNREARVFLKMDTQGYDLEVFAGLQARLGQVFGILSELSVRPIYEDMPDYLQALAEYRNRGFTVSAMFPVNRSADLSLIELDCFLVRPEPLRQAIAT